MIRLETERLVIRDHVESDIADLHLLLSDQEVMYYLPELKTNTITESKHNLATAITEINESNRTKFYLAIIIKSSSEYVGEIGINKMTECSEGNIMNLGYFILKDYWGMGFVPEAARALITYAFNNLGTIKVETGCVKVNNKSFRVMEKLGMYKEAELKKHVVLHDRFYDRLEYGILKEEWQNEC